MERKFSTADLYDSYHQDCTSCELQLRQYGGRRQFFGRIRTVKCLADNALVKRMSQTASSAEALVIDGGGYLGSALMGDMIAAAAAKNGWSGAVIFGAVRDVLALAEMDFGLKALGSNPKTSAKDGKGQIDVPVSFGGIIFSPGDWLYSDEDGILVSTRELDLNAR